MKKFENFKAALVNLNDIFSYKEPYGNVEIAGMVGLYEICFEQSWKAMKELLENLEKKAQSKGIDTRKKLKEQQELQRILSSLGL